MTAVALLDELVRHPPDGAAASALPRRLAERLIEDALADLERLRAYEEEYGSPDIHSDNAAEVLQTVYRLYEEWAADAEKILVRARQFDSEGTRLEKTELLEDASGRVRARLGVTPQKMARAIDQARGGDLVPVETVRNELRARVHG